MTSVLPQDFLKLTLARLLNDFINNDWLAPAGGLQSICSRHF